MKTDLDLAELKHRSVRGGLVTLSAQGASVAIGLVSTVVLARLLSPYDYGVVAMVAAVTAFAGLFRDLGLSSASVQWQTLTRVQQSNLFWVNLAFGAALTGVIAAASPLVSWFYGRPELLWVTVAMSVNISIGSVAAQSGVLLVREMRFGRQAISTTSGAVVGIATAVALAMSGWGYWSLVCGQTLTALTTAGLLLILSPFRPGWPSRGSGLRAMLGFGVNVTAFDFVNYFARNLDNILIGRVWGVGPLGQYSRAYSLLMLPITNLRGPIMAVAFPALSRLQTHPEAYRAYYLRATAVLAAASMPFAMYLLVAAEPAIRLLLGEQWSGVAPIVSYLSLAAFIQPAASLSGSLVLSRGLGRRYLKIGIVNTACVIASFVMGLPWGPSGVALSYGVMNYVLLYPWLTWAFRGSPVSFADFCRACAFPAIASLVAAAGASLINGRIHDLSASSHLLLLALPFGVVALVSTRFTQQGRLFWAGLLALRAHVSPVAGRAS